MSLKYPYDRVNGHVHLTCNGKHFISAVKLTRRKNISKKDNQRLRVIRLVYRICREYHLDRKIIKRWWYVGK